MQSEYQCMNGNAPYRSCSSRASSNKICTLEKMSEMGTYFKVKGQMVFEVSSACKILCSCILLPVVTLLAMFYIQMGNHGVKVSGGHRQAWSVGGI